MRNTRSPVARIAPIALGVAIALAASCANEDLLPASDGTTTTLPGVLTGAPTSALVTSQPVSSPTRGQVPVFYRYEAKSGDTVESVARQFGLRPESVAENNESLLAASSLGAGTLLDIPSVDGILHRIRPGDVLSEVADRYGVDVAVIVNFPSNGLTGAEMLPRAGVILVPGGRRR